MSPSNDHHHRVTLQVATDTWPPELFYIDLSSIRAIREIGHRSPFLTERSFLEVLYVEGFPARPCRALTTVDWVAMALGWFAGYAENLPIADAYLDRPFAPERQAPPAPEPTIAAPAPVPEPAPAPRRRRAEPAAAKQEEPAAPAPVEARAPKAPRRRRTDARPPAAPKPAPAIAAPARTVAKRKDKAASPPFSPAPAPAPRRRRVDPPVAPAPAPRRRQPKTDAPAPAPVEKRRLTPEQKQEARRAYQRDWMRAHVYGPRRAARLAANRA